MTFETLRYDLRDRIATVTFDTPLMLNALTEARFDELERVIEEIETGHEARALIITGEGRAFCVGLDLDLLDRAFDDLDYFERVVRRLNALITRIEALSIPTIAAVNGFARAGGFELTLACDFILVGEGAQIGDVHTDAGVLPACATLRLKRRIGEQRAKALVWTARWLKGREAVDWGLALDSLPDGQLQDGARALANSLVDKPQAVIAAQKALFHATAVAEIQADAERELGSFMTYMRSQPYGREGYKAFRENRQPSWRLSSGPN